MNPQYEDKLVKENVSGVVVRYITEKSFGFIRSNDKNFTDDIYVYFNQIVPTSNRTEKEFLKLHQYQEVTFDLYVSPRGLVAKKVVAGKILTDLLMNQVPDETNFNN